MSQGTDTFKIFWPYILEENWQDFINYNNVRQHTCTVQQEMGHYTSTNFNFLISHSSNQIVLVCPCFVTKQACVSVMSVGI